MIFKNYSLLAGFFFGAVWGWIPGYLKAMRGVNEVITTLLLNYIAVNLVSYLVQNPLMATGAPSPYSPLIAKTSRLPILLPQSLAHAGILFGLIAAVILWVLLVRSPLGYQITAVGFNPIAARYAHISVERTIMLVMAFSGGLAGLAGSCEVMGLKYRLFEQVSPGYGFDAIAIAFLSRGSVVGVVLTSLFLARLVFSGSSTQQLPGIGAITIPGLANIPLIGPLLFQSDFLVYLLFILVILTTYILFKTSFGLTLRAVGESPKAADTAGISVAFVRYIAVVISGCLASLGGAHLTLVQVRFFAEGMSAGKGFIAIAALIFGRWHPIGSALACLLFGATEALQLRIQALGAKYPLPIFSHATSYDRFIGISGISGKIYTS